MTHAIGVDADARSIAILGARSRIVLLAELPECRDAGMEWIDGSALQAMLSAALGREPARCVVQKPAGAWRAGAALLAGARFGAALAILQAHTDGVQLVGHRWKQGMRLPADPLAAVSRARVWYPGADLSRLNAVNRAHALLLAHWAMDRIAADGFPAISTGGAAQ